MQGTVALADLQTGTQLQQELEAGGGKSGRQAVSQLRSGYSDRSDCTVLSESPCFLPRAWLDAISNKWAQVSW